MFRDRECAFAENFRAACAAGDTAQAARLAHDLKSVSGTLGALPLCSAAEALEIACRHGAPGDEVEPLLDAVRARLDPVIQGLRSATLAVGQEFQGR